MIGADRVARQLGSTVRRLRQERDKTQLQVARSAGIPRGAVGAYERGERRPTAPVLAQLLAALQCSEATFSRHFGPFGEVAAIRRTGRL
jgi:transcriptional regulator with XRE-family HTH domain